MHNDILAADGAVLAMRVAYHCQIISIKTKGSFLRFYSAAAGQVSL